LVGFPDQVDHCPVPLTHLDFIQLQPDQFRSTEAATEEHGQHGVIALGTHAIPTSTLEYFRTLLHAQPVAGAKPELFDAFHPADPCSQFGTEQARVGNFVSEATHGCELLVNGVRSQTS
jgi:hypothetical protein